jgi:hypothetical protein
MPPRRKRNRAGRSWRRGSEPSRSVLTRGRRSTSRARNRFSPLEPLQEKLEPSPLYQIPTLRPWLAARERMLWDGTERRRAG